MRTRPDLAQALYQPWWFDKRSGDGPDSFYQRPVYTIDAQGRLATHYGPDYMHSAQRGAHVPPLTPTQREAMEVLNRLNNDPRFVLTMDLSAGDMQLLNNHVILHSRTAYEDCRKGASPRPHPAMAEHQVRRAATDPPQPPDLQEVIAIPGVLCSRDCSTVGSTIFP